MSKLRILFVCTGNTCRSPMALELCRVIAKRRGLVDKLELASCGTNAVAQAPAADDAVAAIAERGGDLSSFYSSLCDGASLEWADAVFCMTRRHIEKLAARWPEHAGKLSLLDPSGSEVPDPWQMGPAAYRKCLEQLDSALTARLEELCG